MRNVIGALFVVVALAGCGGVEPQEEEAASPQFCLNCAFGCLNNSQCAAGTYCKKADGQCGAYGYCDTIPTGLCGWLGNPPPYACGCDGHTYYSACFATKAGVNVAYYGRCH